jgi:aminopeptidase N
MTKKDWLLLLPLLLFSIMLYPELSAQPIHGCALNRMQSVARTALASPQHVKRMNQYDITFYGLDLQLERNSVQIAGTVKLGAKVNGAPLDTFAFELHPNFEIAAIHINGVPQVNISRDGGDVSVKLLSPIQAHHILNATITYQGYAPQNASAAIGNGFNSSLETRFNRNVTWSLSEPYAAYEWWPTKQVLTDKADSVHVFITTSAANKVGANGLLSKVIDLPNGKKRYEWKSRYPIVYYLVSVAVSDYTEYLIHANPPGAAAPIPILNYVYSPEALSQFKSEIDMTVPFLEFYSGIFTLYPFYKEKYGHSMAPMGGGMEHQTMTTQATFTFNLTSHELAHQWFGDNVTCASWKDIWLNEGFASYAEYLALQQFKPLNAASWMKDAHDIAMRLPDGSVRVTDTLNVRRIFDYRLSYKKAAAVVHMLRFKVNNDTLFFKSLQNYQQEFRGKTASTKDLQRVFEQTTGLDLNLFFEQWYAGSGYPVFTVEWNQKGHHVLLAATQTPSSTTNFFKTDMEYRIITATTDTTIRVSHTKPDEQYLVKLKTQEPVTGIEVDPANWVLNALKQVTQNKTLVIPDAGAGKPVVFPNPTSATFKVTNLNFDATEAYLYDSTGKRIWKQQVKEKNELEIDVRQLPAGMYILYLSNAKEYYRTPIIKVGTL